MKLRDVRNRKTPPLMIIPMIDIMFFLLVFFMLSTMYMIDIVTKIACALSKPVAEVDYILWAYCAKEYGEVCTKKGQNWCADVFLGQPR